MNGKEARMFIAHAYGCCITNNCKLGFPKSTGIHIGRSETNVNPKNNNCENKSIYQSIWYWILFIILLTYIVGRYGTDMP